MRAELDAYNLANRLIVNVTINRYDRWLFRLWIAKKLITLAAFIACVGIKINEGNDFRDSSTTERNKYRFMILKLLDNGQDTNISQETRTAAYDLLDEYFEE